MREYVNLSVYQRIFTRPFLSPVEKKWITFQILYALHQAHKFGVCHGDIKLENIVITSWNWVLLTDFASFKPTYLPEDNPADYSYFFDSSRRRSVISCYEVKKLKNYLSTFVYKIIEEKRILHISFVFSLVFNFSIKIFF